MINKTFQKDFGIFTLDSSDESQMRYIMPQSLAHSLGCEYIITISFAYSLYHLKIERWFHTHVLALPVYSTHCLAEEEIYLEMVNWIKDYHNKNKMRLELLGWEQQI